MNRCALGLLAIYALGVWLGGALWLFGIVHGWKFDVWVMYTVAGAAAVALAATALHLKRQ